MTTQVNSSENEWTIMVFFASDNPLSPLLVSQVKAIKDAGFQEQTEVLVYFDPTVKGSPTKIYNVNAKRKAVEPEKSLIGDGNDPFIRNMIEDEIPKEMLTTAMQQSVRNPDTVPAMDSLTNFVQFVLQKHTAKNYILFLVGHGMIVGNDAFLPDSDPISAISLKDLKTVLGNFGTDGNTQLRMLALHSCSMSSIEVAYQLRGTADYMMATQGTAFVNSWPFRQVLKKTFNTIEVANQARKDAVTLGRGKTPEEIKSELENAKVDVRTLVEKLYFLCLFNATDFMSAGYSADLALVSLKPDKLRDIKKPIQDLVKRLKSHLIPESSAVKDLILLAHWESQSFWEENYADLFDFCRCLRRRCRERAKTIEDQLTLKDAKEADILGAKADLDELVEVAKDCKTLMDMLDVVRSADQEKRFKQLVIQEENFGNQYQFAHGLSVFFPWNRPDDDVTIIDDGKPHRRKTDQKKPSVMESYDEYDFTTDFGADSWASFLKMYFDKTIRMSRKKEELRAGTPGWQELDKEDADISFNDAEFLADKAFDENGVLDRMRILPPKRTPEEGTRTPDEGVGCTCPTIKNHPKEFSITPGALRAFRSRRRNTQFD